MPCSIEPSEDKKYIIQKVEGDITRELAMAYNQETHALGKELGINRFLVDVRESRNVSSVADNYEFAYKDMQKAPDIDRSARVAMLVSPGDHSHDFVETVARNSGLSVRIFTDLEAAINYLTAET